MGVGIYQNIQKNNPLSFEQSFPKSYHLLIYSFTFNGIKPILINKWLKFVYTNFYANITNLNKRIQLNDNNKIIRKIVIFLESVKGPPDAQNLSLKFIIQRVKNLVFI